MTSAAGEGPLVGRSAQLAAVRAALRAATEGATTAVFLIGESGVGKTRLLAEAAAELRRDGAVVLSGQCLDIGDASPLYPLRQALRRVARNVDGSADPSPAVARDLLDLLDRGAGTERSSTANAGSESVGRDGAGALLDRLSQGLAAMAGERPAVLVIDDLQWADRTTRQLLLYLLAGLGELRLLLLGAVRAESLHLNPPHLGGPHQDAPRRQVPHPAPPTVQAANVEAASAEGRRGVDPLRSMMLELRRMRSVRVMELDPLDRAATAELAAAIMGRSAGPDAVTADGLSDDALDAVWERSGGNPFIVEELVRHTRDGNAGLSDTLREIVLARVDALPPHVHAVAYGLAAGVEPVAHELLAAVVPLDEEQLNDAVRLAVSQRVLAVADDGYRFHHRLIKEVLEPRLLPGEALGLHRRYAEALTGAPTGTLRQARLAYHWERAREPARALVAAAAAAEEAERLHGYAEAYEHWSQALRLASGPGTGVAGGVAGAGGHTVDELRERAAEAAHRCGEHDRALAILEELAKAGETAGPGRRSDPELWLHTTRARYLAAVGRLAEAETEYERALSEPARSGPAAVPGARAPGPEPQRALAAAHSAQLLVQLGRYVDAGRRAREALDLAGPAPDSPASASAAVLANAALGFSRAYLAEPATVPGVGPAPTAPGADAAPAGGGLAAVEEALRIAERAGSPVDVGSAYLHLADLLSGPLNELEKGIEVARTGAARAGELGLARTYGTRLLAAAANGLFRAGRWADAAETIASALRQRPAGTDAVDLLLARCRLAVGYGDLDGAERDLEAVETLLAGGGARYVLPLLTLRAGLAIWRGRYGDARRAVQQALGPDTGRSDDIWLLAPVVWHGLRAEAEAAASGPGTDRPDPAAVAVLRRVAAEITAASAYAARPVRDAVAGYQALCDAELTRLAGHPDPAAWSAAAAIWARRHHPYPAAYALLRQADALYSQRTRNAEAATALRAAYRTASRLGAQPFIAEIRGLADRARVVLDEPTPDPAPSPPAYADVRPATPVSTGGDLAGLTDRELQVLAEVAAGRTNQEIADLLYISQRTVGVHVSRILHKLQVRTRVQATSIYLRHYR